jgi:hypothetical protein
MNATIEGIVKGGVLCEDRAEVLLLLFILTANGVLPGVSDTTIRHNTQITHHTKLHTTLKQNTAPRMEASLNISTVALRVVGGDENGTQYFGYNWPNCSWGYKYGDLTLQVGGVSNLRQ